MVILFVIIITFVIRKFCQKRLAICRNLASVWMLKGNYSETRLNILAATTVAPLFLCQSQDNHTF